MALTHNELKQAALKLLRLHGHFAWLNNTGRRGKVSYGYPGSPDILAILQPSGRFLGVEVKVGKDELRLDQVRFKEEVEKRNALFVECREIYDVVKCLDL